MKRILSISVTAFLCLEASGLDLAPPPVPPGPEGWLFREELARDRPGRPFVAPGGKPWLENRISRCFFSPIKRPPFNRDELADDIDYYPDAYLERLSGEGVNGLWISTSFVDLMQGGRIAKLRKTVEKCARYGIKIWIFGIEPRSRPSNDPFFAANPDAKGVRTWDGNHVFCASSAATVKYVENKMERIFREVPGLGGMINIVSGERATTCMSLADPGKDKPQLPCGRCSKRPVWELYRDVSGAMARGMLKSNPSAKLITWFYHPGQSPVRGVWVEECVRNAPEGVVPQYNFESGSERVQEGLTRAGGDYWLSVPGPARPFRTFAGAARKAGVRISAKIQTSCSHECATVPYVPVPGLLYRKFKAMKEQGVRDVMMCWYFGNAPGLMNRAAGRLAYEDFSSTEEEFLEKLAKEEWGEDAAAVGWLWKRFSDAYSNYPLSNRMQYYGPFHAGFSWPLYPKIEMRSLQRTWKPLETPGGDMMAEALSGFTLEEVLSCTEKMNSFLTPDVRARLERLRAKYAGDRDRRRDLAVMMTLMNLFKSAQDVFEFYLLRREAVSASRFSSDNARSRSCLSKMKDIVGRQKLISAEMMALCDDDSRLGFHSEAESHQFDSKYLAWRITALDAALGEIKEIDEVLAAGGAYPLSGRERTAVEIAARRNPDGSLLLSGSCKKGAGPLEIRTYDLCASREVKVTSVVPDGDRWSLTIPAQECRDRSSAPAWIVCRQGRDFNNGGTVWAFPDVPMFPEPRLDQFMLTGDNFARITVK